MISWARRIGWILCRHWVLVRTVHWRELVVGVLTMLLRRGAISAGILLVLVLLLVFLLLVLLLMVRIHVVDPRVPVGGGCRVGMGGR